MKNLIVGLLAKLLKILRRIILILFFPYYLFFQLLKRRFFPSSSPLFWPKNKAPVLRMPVAYLPLETFAEIMQFADTDDLNQKMVFVSRAFAALAFPLLRRRFAVRISHWRKDFENPIESDWFEHYLLSQHVLLKKASIQNMHIPILHGTVQVVKPMKSDSSFDLSSRPGVGEEVLILWKANEAESWEVHRTHFTGNGLWGRLEFQFRFPVPVNRQKFLLQPFMDGNHRCGRLLQDFILMHFGYPPACIFDEEIAEYLEKTEEARRFEGADLRPFLRFISEKCMPKTFEALFHKKIDNPAELLTKYRQIEGVYDGQEGGGWSGIFKAVLGAFNPELLNF